MKGREKKDPSKKKNRERRRGKNLKSEQKILAGGLQATTEPLLHCSYCEILPDAVYFRLQRRPKCDHYRVFTEFYWIQLPAARRAPSAEAATERRFPALAHLIPWNQRVNSALRPFASSVSASAQREQRELQGLAGA